jgi:hypothetical protein
MLRSRTAIAAGLMLAAALTAGGCDAGSSPDPASPALPAPPAPSHSPALAAPSAGPAGAGPHNDADVAFVRALIPHHREGIALASAAAAARPGARTLAAAIIATEQDEIVRMTSWLTAWNAPAAPSASPSAPAPADPVAALAGHQAEAVTIAQREQSGGLNAGALDFARQIIESRTGQIEQLAATPK